MTTAECLKALTGAIPAAVLILTIKQSPGMANKMKKYTIKQLKSLVNSGAAIDVTHANSKSEIPESYTQVGYASGVYGCNGMLLKGESGQLYAVTGRTMAIYIF